MHSSFIFLLLQLWMSVKVSSSQNACSGLPNVPNSQVSENTKKAEYQKGDVVRFTCDTGYISGPTITYMCSPQSGGWVAVRGGSCYLKPCELPDDTDNGYYQIIKGEDLVSGTTIQYFCNEGYHMVSREDTRTCLLDRWTNPICEPNQDCGEPPFLTNGDTTETSRTHYKRNERVHYSCKAYHTMEGEPYRTCINGKWSGEIKCLKPCTVDKEAMRSHNIRFRYTSDDKLYSVHLQWIEFTCTGGTSHVGTIEMRQRCVDGVMLLPTCQ